MVKRGLGKGVVSPKTAQAMSIKPVPRAFVFGNAALDETFQVQALPAQGESVLARTQHVGLGGKGANQAIALARTGVPTVFVSAVGTDTQGRDILTALDREPLECTVLERPQIASDRSMILAQDDGENVVITTNECAQSVTLEDCRAVLSRARSGDVVILQGNLDTHVTGSLCRECKRLGLSVVLNPSPFHRALCEFLPHADVLFVNAVEALALSNLTGKGAVMSLLQAGADTVVLTLGEEGSLLGSARGLTHVPACGTDVVDVTGAGDCFEGMAIGSALLRRCSIDERALHHASQAAALVIGKAGAVRAFPSAEQMASILSTSGP